MKQKTFLLFFLLLTLLFTGCGKEDCSLKDSTYEKYTWNEDSKQCIAKLLEKDVCGNGIAEDNENSCNCPQDIKKENSAYCGGLKGEYLEMTCNEVDECVLKQNDKVIEETKSIQLKNTDIIIDSLLTYPKPYILNTEDKNKITIDVSLFKYVSTSKNIRNLLIKDLKIENAGSNVYGSATYNENLLNVGNSLPRKTIELKETGAYFTRENLRIKLTTSYTVEYLNTQGEVTKTENKIETLIGTIGSFDIINANFDYKK